jgi:hypothetical protein
MRSAAMFVFGAGFITAIALGIAYAPALVILGLGALLVYITVTRQANDA